MYGYHNQQDYANARNLSGITYNLDSGMVTEQLLDADNIANTSFNIANNSFRNLEEKKISMPSVHEGSVIDYSFEMDRHLTRDFCQWEIESDLPKLYSEVELLFPNRFKVVTLRQRVHNFSKDVDERNDSLLPDAFITEEHSSSTFNDIRYVRRNIPAIPREPFVYSMNNFREQMIFSIINVSGTYANEKYTWEKVNDLLYNSSDFYRAVAKKDKEVSVLAVALAGGETNDLLKAQKIFTYVRDSITHNTGWGIGIKNYPGDVLAHRTGSVSEINMLLVSMLHAVDIDADPVVLSTRDNCRVSDLLPDLSHFNYMVCFASLNNKEYYLDASGKYNPFGVIPQKCYNGYARLINKKGRAVIMAPDSLKETELYSLATENNSDTAYKLSITCSFGKYAALWHRNNWNKDSAEIKDYINNVLKEMPLDLQLKNYEIEHLAVPDSELVIVIHAAAEWPANAKTVYLSPFLLRFFDKNPFKNEDRQYPVEMPYLYNYIYRCQLRLPAGFTLEDPLRPFKVRLGENAVYENEVTYDKATNTVGVYAHTQTRKTGFAVAEYPALKEFFDRMLAAEQATMVIKKP